MANAGHSVKLVRVMSFPCRSCFHTLQIAFTLWLMTACSSTQQALEGQGRSAVDFSGSWELDYGQSDNIQAKLDAMVRDLRREAERRNRNAAMSTQGPGASLVVGGGGANSGASILGLARMAELITRPPLLEIKQDEHNIRVKREESFALTCEFHPGQFHTVETPFGTEACGWDGHQLVFRILLPEGLSIQHVFTLGPQGQRLNIATTVVSDQVSYPFTLNRVFNRFVPGNRGYRCTQTLSRGRVCTTESP
jgi:hypothetical protein